MLPRAERLHGGGRLLRSGQRVCPTPMCSEADRGRLHSIAVSKPARKLVEEAMRLSPKARLDVAAQLIASVEVPGRPVAGAAWEAAWRNELDRRWTEAERSGDFGESIALPRAGRVAR
jgi:hypothetical protein